MISPQVRARRGRQMAYDVAFDRNLKRLTRRCQIMIRLSWLAPATVMRRYHRATTHSSPRKTADITHRGSYADQASTHFFIDTGRAAF